MCVFLLALRNPGLKALASLPWYPFRGEGDSRISPAPPAPPPWLQRWRPRIELNAERIDVNRVIRVSKWGNPTKKTQYICVYTNVGIFHFAPLKYKPPKKSQSKRLPSIFGVLQGPVLEVNGLLHTLLESLCKQLDRSRVNVDGLASLLKQMR